MLLQGGLAVERMCFLAGVSRAGFYRYLRAQDLSPRSKLEAETRSYLTDGASTLSQNCHERSCLNKGFTASA
jgi:hypothetical protein